MSPIINRGRLYVGDIAGILYVIDASNGALLTSRLFAEPFTTSPPVVIGNVVIVANDTHVYAIPIR